MSVDVYQGELQGLVVAEVEFSSQSEAEQFLPPTWCEVEVTHEPQYKNQSLALEGVPVSLMPSPHRKP